MQATESAAALNIRDLRKRFGPVTALDGLSLSVASGEIYGLLGANGAGKTTALRIVCGLLQPDGGSGECLGRPLGARQDSLGYMAQRGGLYDDLSIRENLLFFARAHGLDASKADASIDEHGLSARAKQRVGVLSGGWRQRVALAAALLHAPPLLLLDEPSAGLDPQARESLWDRLRELAASPRKTTILVSTHYADEAERCDRIGYLEAGRLRIEGVPDQLSAQLQLGVWKTAASAPLPPGGACRVRDAAGWRVLAPAPDGASSESFRQWLREHDAEPVPPRLSDALSWLAISPEKRA